MPQNRYNILMLVPFIDDAGAEAVSAIFRAGIVPSALEFMKETLSTGRYNIMILAI
ncbi:hypothetical protein QW060_25510 [Myroides ceti]|uniref:Uncharacterized protein n=1 Tax=Paenimyroides ceti TaxID=395087 RepID=A0ABT8D053_9FLAO|nr:hypothetical protein [Paenimyroides ceti]MDN3710225.1 hypothetical protein [Paenimyroides ceti]